MTTWAELKDDEGLSGEGWKVEKLPTGDWGGSAYGYMFDGCGSREHALGVALGYAEKSIAWFQRGEFDGTISTTDELTPAECAAIWQYFAEHCELSPELQKVVLQDVRNDERQRFMNFIRMGAEWALSTARYLKHD